VAVEITYSKLREELASLLREGRRFDRAGEIARDALGIRMALGAEQSRVLRMVLREIAILVGVGIGAALVTTRLVASFLYGLQPDDPCTLGVAATIMTMVAAIAGYSPLAGLPVSTRRPPFVRNSNQ